MPNVYYLCIMLFGILSIGFSFGDIENSKWLQIISSILRIFVLICMYIGTAYYLVDDGI